MNALPPPGWYPDPQWHGYWRYWDGVSWTEHRAPVLRPRSSGSTTRGGHLGRLVLAVISVVIVLLVVIGGVGAMLSGTSDEANQSTAQSLPTQSWPSPERSSSADRAPEEQRPDKGDSKSLGQLENPADKETSSAGKPSGGRGSSPRKRLAWVARVIDGDTIELGNGESVRLVGMDSPEVGECGFDAAAANLARLVLGRQVRLTVSDEDRDAYGRLLRYVDVGGVDAGLRQIKAGLAIARYDSRDGYGRHPREAVYIAADAASPDKRCGRSPRSFAGTAEPKRSCEAGYEPCVPAFPPDVDCADVDGPISVTGSDPHRLDADNDGVACEW